MFNVGPGELLVILVVALIVLGPDKLPDAARKIGNVMGELRRMSAGFQEEIRSAMDAPVQAVRSVTADPPSAPPAPTPIDRSERAELPAPTTPVGADAADDDIAPVDPTGTTGPQPRSADPAA